MFPDLNFSSGSSQIWMWHMAGWLVMVATCCAKLAGSGEESVRTEHQHGDGVYSRCLGLV